MKKTPDLSEYKGPYNVTEEDALDLFEYTGTVLRTVPDLPVLTYRELFAIDKDIVAVLKSEHRGSLPVGVDLDNHYRHCAGDHLGDRTADVILPDARLLTPRLIRQFQSRVLKHWPAWRIRIRGHTRATNVLVYPRQVRIVGHPAGVPLADHLARIAEREHRRNETREGPQRRQVEWLQRRFKAEPLKLAPGEFRVIAAFDRWRDEKEVFSLWVLLNDKKRHTLRIITRDASVGEHFRVAADGTFSWEVNNWPLCLQQWILPKALLGRSLRFKLDGSTHVTKYLVRAEELIRDRDLKKAEELRRVEGS